MGLQREHARAMHHAPHVRRALWLLTGAWGLARPCTRVRLVLLGPQSRGLAHEGGRTDLLDFDAFGGRLLGDQAVPQHLLAQIRHLLWTAGTQTNE
jgi:hypothetical protein